MLNKSDLRQQWSIETERLEELRADGWRVIETSALDGANVDAAFELLARTLSAEES